MGCGASVPKVPPKSGVIEAELEHWWNTIGEKGLRQCYMDSSYDDKEKWADSMCQFITNSFKVVKHMQKGSAEHKDTVTKAEYIAEYKKALAGRKNVREDNLYKLKVEADAYLKKMTKQKVDPALKLLLHTLYKEKETLAWSQGHFGPQQLSADFLQQYANAMISGKLWERQAKDTHQTALNGSKQFLECGMFFIKPGCEFSLHWHETQEAYYIIGGKTRFVLLIDGKLQTIEKKAGEWHFNPPWVPHAIVTPHGEPHASLWFREGGVGESENDKYGYKWISDVDGIEMMEPEQKTVWEEFCTIARLGQAQRHNSDPNLVGSLGFKPGTMGNADQDSYFRMLTPSQYSYLSENPDNLKKVCEVLKPERKDILNSTIDQLRFHSKRGKSQIFT